ncbi:MAG: hypothetical protein IPI65_17315 [Bacteroidetes bacterium]|nr:hypothetical protein [Bacteroidota bacterium]
MKNQFHLIFLLWRPFAKTQNPLGDSTCAYRNSVQSECSKWRCAVFDGINTPTFGINGDILGLQLLLINGIGLQ